MKRHPLPSRPPGMRTFQLKTPVELARRIDARAAELGMGRAKIGEAFGNDRRAFIPLTCHINSGIQKEGLSLLFTPNWDVRDLT